MKIVSFHSRIDDLGKVHLPFKFHRSAQGLASPLGAALAAGDGEANPSTSTLASSLG